MLYYILAACVVYLVTLAYFFLPSPYLEGSKFARRNESVAVLVLGDVGRSPRMQYHAGSLSRAGFKVDLVGYAGTLPHGDLLSDTDVRYHAVPEPPATLTASPRWSFPLVGPLKVLHQLFFLYLILGYAIDPPAYLLVQNPPSIPTLLLARLICRLRGSRLVVDWHNLGYSVLALKLGRGHVLVRVAEAYERFFGRSAYAHLAVTDAMAGFLREDLNVRGRVETLHDRPAAQFRPLSAGERAAFLASCPETRDMDPAADKLVVSSTSWTEDEDFGVLLDALVRYDGEAEPGVTRPRLRVVITGKGPRREHYLAKLAALRFERVSVRTAWLSADDYPRLLACADLGVSLHTSTSGLDLPMKVVDMFGCGVPVLALHFSCLHELVVSGLNGRSFADAEDLAECLAGLLGRPDDDADDDDGDGLGGAHLRELKAGATREGEKRWEDEWRRVCGPIFQRRSS